MTIDLEAINARAEAATPGPWLVEIEGGQNGDGEGWSEVCVSFDGANSLLPEGQSFSLTPGLMMGWHEGNDDDAEFIAASRTDVPALVAEVRRLTTIVEAVEKVRQRLDHGHVVGVMRQTVADELRAALSPSVPLVEPSGDGE